VHGRVSGIQLERLADVLDRLVGAPLLHEDPAELVVILPIVRAPVLGLAREGLLQLVDRLVLLSFLREIVRTVEMLAVRDRGNDDLAKALVRGVDELGNVGGAVLRLRALDQDRRAVRPPASMWVNSSCTGC
jgi:hypothetical protein